MIFFFWWGGGQEKEVVLICLATFSLMVTYPTKSLIQLRLHPPCANKPMVITQTNQRFVFPFGSQRVLINNEITQVKDPKKR